VSPDVVMRARAAAPEVLVELADRGLEELIVSDRDVVWVRSPVHELPVPLHDVDDVRWFALEVAGA
jgi:hypothetical protein